MRWRDRCRHVHWRIPDRKPGGCNGRRIFRPAPAAGTFYAGLAAPNSCDSAATANPADAVPSDATLAAPRDAAVTAAGDTSDADARSDAAAANWCAAASCKANTSFRFAVVQDPDCAAEGCVTGGTAGADFGSFGYSAITA